MVVVIEENTDYGQVIGDRVNAPFINELADGGVNFTEFYSITPPEPAELPPPFLGRQSRRRR